ncbi:PREDICTED: uncharacterized protein LOC106332709 isoform X13 [Brassica oleracea var. oleracea]|uniref:uncharacterized protein LOC106332709 isoform X13 n=1 Tax=Brassica oleracea var. oleracea TaxID=109376 RepID=UPI0006A74B37|nr:PREDICTED: uncharacterized protein LOC106332709 isoform X13 [Brassica oleracea var. oleracea]
MCGCMLYTSPTTDRQGEASVGEDPRERGQYESEVHRSGGAQSHQRTDKNPLQLTTLERGPVLNLLRSRKQICTGIKERLSTASAGLNQVNKNARKILREL